MFVAEIFLDPLAIIFDFSLFTWSTARIVDLGTCIALVIWRIESELLEWHLVLQEYVLFLTSQLASIFRTRALPDAGN